MTKKDLLLVFIGIAIGLIIFWLVTKLNSIPKLLSPGSVSSVPKPRPLDAYSYENLKQRQYIPSDIIFENQTFIDNTHSIWLISFKSDGKRVSGVANLPISVSTTSGFVKPVIILVHGFATKEEYYPGFGTERIAKILASNGLITIAPDFLGYGTSDNPSLDVFEERFQAYTTVLNLISSTKNQCLNCKIGLWGHSNGGQIALSVLEISGQPIPTTLWNPVSKTFPFSILYYTDDFDDHGKELRKALANFEGSYDVERYSIPNFLDWITAPILLQQGGADKSVPQKWSDELDEQLVQKQKDIDYKVYPGADHNMLPVWGQVSTDTLNFFKSRF